MPADRVGISQHQLVPGMASDGRRAPEEVIRLILYEYINRKNRVELKGQTHCKRNIERLKNIVCFPSLIIDSANDTGAEYMFLWRCC